jgi:hypothetical protein
MDMDDVSGIKIVRYIQEDEPPVTRLSAKTRFEGPIPGLRKPGIDARRIKKSIRLEHENMRKFSVINVSSL